MGKEEILDYVMNSPSNTNPSVLKGMLNSATDGGESGGNKVLKTIKIQASAIENGNYDFNLFNDETVVPILQNMSEDDIIQLIVGVEYLDTNYSPIKGITMTCTHIYSVTLPDGTDITNWFCLPSDPYPYPYLKPDVDEEEFEQLLVEHDASWDDIIYDIDCSVYSFTINTILYTGSMGNIPVDYVLTCYLYEHTEEGEEVDEEPVTYPAGYIRSSSRIDPLKNRKLHYNTQSHTIKPIPESFYDYVGCSIEGYPSIGNVAFILDFRHGFPGGVFDVATNGEIKQFSIDSSTGEFTPVTT